MMLSDRKGGEADFVGGGSFLEYIQFSNNLAQELQHMNLPTCSKICQNVLQS